MRAFKSKPDEELLAIKTEEDKDSLERYHKNVEKSAAIKTRYDAMESQVLAWEPPTPDHQGLKNFMLNQIVDSRKFDAYTYEKPVVLSFEES